MDYALDEKSGKLVLQNREELVANAGEEAASLYALEVDAPDGIEINFDVHDIDVSHRLYSDYYGDDILDITLHNYYQNGEAIELTCAMYLNGASEPVFVSLPYDPEVISVGTATTISVPLKALFDPETVQSARFVFTPRGISETATVNNEFTIYPGGWGDRLHFTQDLQAEITRGGKTLTYTGTVPARVGETVTLHASVTGGTKPYSYQWQVYNPATGEWVNLRDGKGISGANADTLTLKGVKAEWDGRQARCVVTDSNGETVTSDPITLRVAQPGGSTPPDTGDHANLPLYLTIAVRNAGAYRPYTF